MTPGDGKPRLHTQAEIDEVARIVQSVHQKYVYKTPALDMGDVISETLIKLVRVERGKNPHSQSKGRKWSSWVSFVARGIIWNMKQKKTRRPMLVLVGPGGGVPAEIHHHRHADQDVETALVEALDYTSHRFTEEDMRRWNDSNSDD